MKTASNASMPKVRKTILCTFDSHIGFLAVDIHNDDVFHGPVDPVLFRNGEPFFEAGA